MRRGGRGSWRRRCAPARGRPWQRARAAGGPPGARRGRTPRRARERARERRRRTEERAVAADVSVLHGGVVGREDVDAASGGITEAEGRSA
jgi:hypothetical protein